MDKRSIYKTIIVALLAAGSAILLSSCRKEIQQEEEPDYDSLQTQKGDSIVAIESTNGQLKFSFRAKTMIGYDHEKAKTPYREFPDGIEVITYADSTGAVASRLIADYAIEMVNDKIWEAKGNVVATNADGHKLETQQLFWNQRSGKIYSYVDSKVTQGRDVMVGVGFESNEAFTEWEFRRPRGTVSVENDPDGPPRGGLFSAGGGSGKRSDNSGGGTHATTHTAVPKPATAGAAAPSADGQTRRPVTRPHAGLGTSQLEHNMKERINTSASAIPSTSQEMSVQQIEMAAPATAVMPAKVEPEKITTGQ